MRKWIFSGLIAAAMGAVAVPTASAHQLCRGYLPKNDLQIPEGQLHILSIGQAQFDAVLDRLQAMYGSEIAARGGRFVIDRRWKDGTVNAFATREGRDWKITMFGGFARFPGITTDAFASAACHELGHHLGGAPKWDGDWLSVEGQSDYYGMSKCMKRYFAKDDNEQALAKMKLDPVAVRECNAVHRSKQDRQICIRIAMASLSLNKLLVYFNGGAEPRLDTPDPRVVRTTFQNHPDSQCRTDTNFAGALCTVSPFAAVSDTNAAIGYCSDSRTYSKGLRPRCWFKP